MAYTPDTRDPVASPEIDIYIGPDADRLEAGRPEPGPYAELIDGTNLPLYELGEPERTTVDGVPATLERVSAFTDEELDLLNASDEIIYMTLDAMVLDGDAWVLRCQPVDGLHAIIQVRGGDRESAATAAGALRLDRAQRCAVPLRLDAVPDSAEWTECRTSVRHDPAGDRVSWALSSLTLDIPGGDPISIYAEDAEQATHPSDPPIEPNRTVAGHPAWWSTESPAGLFVPAFGPASVFIAGTDERQASWLVERLRFAGELDAPGGWPLRAIG